MRRLVHALAHRIGVNGGRSQSHWEGGTLVTCFVCAGCGKREDCFDATVHRA